MSDSKLALFIPRGNFALTNENWLPALGACYISSYLKSKKVDHFYIDNYLEQLSNETIADLFESKNINAIACYIPSRKFLLTFLELVVLLDKKNKRNRIAVALSGPFVRLAYAEVLSSIRRIDCVILDGDEQVIFDLVKIGFAKELLRRISSVAYFDASENAVVLTPSGGRTNKLSPSPDYSYYLKKFGSKIHYTLCLASGCFRKCSFCNVPLVTTIKKRDIDHLETILNFFRVNGIDCFTIVDDNFFNLVGRCAVKVEALCKALRYFKANYKTNWKFGISIRIDDIVDNRRRLSELKKVGLVSVFVGVETFDDKTLKLFNKGLKCDEILKAIDILESIELGYSVGFIFFHPWTTVNEIVKNMTILKSFVSERKFLKRIAPIQSIDLLYGTKLYKKAIAEGLAEGSPLKGVAYSFSDKDVESIFLSWNKKNKFILRQWSKTKERDTKQLVLDQLHEIETCLEKYT